jgi:nucleotidyltransferase/DNA polymerase involved in DNA repair
LQKKGFSFRTVSVKVRQADFTTFTRARTLDHDTMDLDTIRRVSGELAREFFDGRKIRLLGIRLSNLGKNKLRQTTLEDFM